MINWGFQYNSILDRFSPQSLLNELTIKSQQINTSCDIGDIHCAALLSRKPHAANHRFVSSPSFYARNNNSFDFCTNIDLVQS